jgi:small-conductance mechanosensitive channel
LSVGIGLGLQSIVNNFVSGIVLIFERPIEVGDSIEIGGIHGTVKEIGLRSSTLISGSGAEIIVPNGDFLSQHIINWTLSNPYMRIELPLNVAPDSDIALISKIVVEEVAHHPNVLPSVIVNTINHYRTGLTVYFWCSDVRKADELKSDVLKSIKEKLLIVGIKLL